MGDVDSGTSDHSATAAAVGGLAREVEQLRRTVERLRLLPGRVEQLAGVVTELAEAAAGRADGRVGPVSWLDIAGGDTAAAVLLLTRLADWLGSVFLRYADAAQALPGCWLWHPDVVEELLWLRAAWLAAYQDQDASVQAAGDWHDRLRPGVVRRLRDLAGGCSIEAHRPGGDARSLTGPVPAADAAGPVAAWWTTDPDGTPPAPTAEQLAAAAARRRSTPRSWA